MSDKITIYDTTLRDGTQGEGFSLSGLDKIRIAQKLDAFGVNYIEGGWPGSNPKDIEFFQEAAKITWKNAKITAFGSTRRANTPVEDDPQVALLISANTPVVTIFGKSWDLHVTEVLRTTLEENQAMIRDTCRHLKEAGKEVIYDAEHFFDGFKNGHRNGGNHALDTLLAAVDGGADYVVLCDTNGGTLPHEVAEITKLVCQILPQVKVGIHTHNDCELAVANAVESCRAGASQVQGTINGYGERTGNCNLTSVIPILQLKLGHQIVPNLQDLQDLSFFVDDISNNPHFIRAPFIGQTAFAHKGGMHVNAVQKIAHSYEHIKPELVGNTQNILVSELSGQSNILITAEKLGLPLQKGSPEAKDILTAIKEREQLGYSYESADGSLELLIRQKLGLAKRPWKLKEYHCAFRQYRSLDGHQEHSAICDATVKLDILKSKSEAPFAEATAGKTEAIVSELTAAEGHGVVNALDQAFRKALRPHFPSIDQVELIDYKVRIIDGEKATAAKTRVLIVLTDGQENWGTVGVSDSIIEASWIALTDGLDLFLQKQNT